jgi:DNA-binding response OmpR family regulator
MPDRILIIEYDSALRDKLISTLSGAGFIVAAVSDYLPALSKLYRFKPDLVVVDVALPSANSMEVCRQIHNTLNIPVVLLGQEHTNEAWEIALQADTYLYLAKPVDYQLLLERINTLLRRYKTGNK